MALFTTHLDRVNLVSSISIVSRAVFASYQVERRRDTNSISLISVVFFRAKGSADGFTNTTRKKYIPGL